MTALMKSSVLAVALLIAATTGGHAMNDGTVLEDLARTGSIITPYGINGR